MIIGFDHEAVHEALLNLQTQAIQQRLARKRRFADEFYAEKQAKADADWEPFNDRIVEARGLAMADALARTQSALLPQDCGPMVGGKWPA